jgi:Putative adhesin
MKRGTPVRRGGGFVGAVILLAVLGLVAVGVNHRGRVNGPWNWGNRNNQDFDIFNMMGQPEHNVDQAMISEAVPANAAIDIENPRGDVSVTVNAGSNVEVKAHQIAYAESDGEAQKIFDGEKASVKVSGAAVAVQTSGNDRGRVNLEVTVPVGAKVTVNAGRGDVTADGIGAGISINAQRGDVRLNSITGATLVHFSKGDLTAHNMQGDVTGEGSCGDVTVTDVKGGLSLSCQYFNDMHLEQIGGALRLRTAKTDVQIAQLPGDLSLNDDMLSVAQAKGTVHVVTHSRDVDLTEIYGDSFVQNSDGSVAVAPAGPFSVEAHNSKGNVEITLPPNASGTVTGRSHNGDIVTDYELNVSGDQDKTVSGRVGAGTAKIVLSAENGDLHIKKGSAMPASPPMPVAPSAPPPPPNAKRLKGMPTQPVTQ